MFRDGALEYIRQRVEWLGDREQLFDLHLVSASRNRLWSVSRDIAMLELTPSAISDLSCSAGGVGLIHDNKEQTEALG